MAPQPVSYAENGEDLRLLEIFGPAYAGVFVEVGAHEPKFLSNSYLLEQNGWRGVLVEPQPEMAARLRAERPGSTVFACAAGAPDGPREVTLFTPGERPAEAFIASEPPRGFEGATATIEVAPLDTLLVRAGLERVDVLSVDTEGFEVPVLQGFDFARWRPPVVLIEDHCEDYSRRHHMKRQGYTPVCRTGLNEWYVPREQAGRFPKHLRTPRFERIRKWYLSMPLRQLRLAIRRRRGRHWRARTGDPG